MGSDCCLQIYEVNMQVHQQIVPHKLRVQSPAMLSCRAAQKAQVAHKMGKMLG